MAGPGCAKCGGEMEVGYLLDNIPGGRLPTTWVQGEPVPSIWLGLSTTDRLVLRVETYRCTSCGHLESYARPPDEGGGPRT